MGTQYRCKNEGRRNAIKNQAVPAINGIDYLVVESGQKKLKVHFFFDLPAGAGKLARENVRIEGGVRIRNIHVLDAESLNNILIVTVESPGDYSTYTLSLTRSQTDLENPDVLTCNYPG